MTMLELPTEDRADVGYVPAICPDDTRWEYERLDLERTRVTHLASGLRRDYYDRAVLDQMVSGHTPSNRLTKDFRGLALFHLDDPASTFAERAAAIRAVEAFGVVDAQCHCDGYLAYELGRKWIHVNVCRDCIEDPDGCPDGHLKRACLNPAPVQCGHILCRAASQYPASRACGMDRDCCGRHDCDTAMTALTATDRAFIPVQAPAVVELGADR